MSVNLVLKLHDLFGINLSTKVSGPFNDMVKIRAIIM